MQANRHLDAATLALAQAVRMLVSIITNSAIGHEMQAREALPRVTTLLRDAESLLVGEVREQARAN